MNEQDIIAKLQKENEFLKQQLKQLGYIYVSPDTKLTTAEKVTVFMSYFKGREDVVAKRYYHRQKNLYAYTYDCFIEFKNGCAKGKQKINCLTCPIRQFKPYNYDTVLAHFTGLNNNGYGIYPLLKDNTCNFLAFDFDGDTWFEEMLSVYKSALKYHIQAVMERSSSGMGGHLWIFFATAIKASLARKLGQTLLQQAMLLDKSIPFSAFDRLFPNQDSLLPNGLGNLIALPLRNEAVKRGNCVFINPARQIIDNQIGYLSQIPKVTYEQCLIILNQFCDDYFFEQDQLSLSLVAESKYSHHLSYTEAQLLTIDKTTLNAATLNALRRLASMINPEYIELMRLKKYINPSKTPYVLQVFEEDERYLYLPRGLKSKLHQLLSGTQFQVEDRRCLGIPVDVEFKGTLSEVQEMAVEKLMKHSMGVLKAVPGFGKTVLALYLLAQLKRSTLILVQSKELQNQWLERIRQFLSFENSEKESLVGIYHGSKKKLTGKIDVAIANSLSKSPQLKEILQQYGVIIIDECHHTAANSFLRLLKNAPCKYIYGFSATLKRQDGLEKLIYMFCGPLRYQTTAADLAKRQAFKRLLIPRYTSYRSFDKDKTYTQLCTDLMNDLTRNTMIIHDVLQEIRNESKTIILSERIEHLEILYGMLNQSMEHAYLLTGKTGLKERKKILDCIRNLPSGENYLLLATSKLLGEGFDLPSLQTLFLVLPISDEGRIEQYTGRTHRESEGKTQVKVYDYIDIHLAMMNNMYQKRLQKYLKLGYYVQERDTSVTEIHKIIYDKQQFQDQFMLDLKSCKKEILFFSSHFNETQFKRYFTSLKEAVQNGVRLYLIVKSEFTPSQDIISLFNAIALQVLHQPSPKNFVILERTCLWHSNHDVLSVLRSDFMGLRLNDKKLIDEIISGMDLKDNRKDKISDAQNENGDFLSLFSDLTN